VAISASQLNYTGGVAWTVPENERFARFSAAASEGGNRSVFCARLCGGRSREENPLENTAVADCGCEIEANDRGENRTLIAVLAINALMFLLEFGFGVAAQSTGLISDSLDMFADALVYAISLYAVGRSAVLKAKAAALSGLLQILLGAGASAEVVRRYVSGSDPVSSVMVAVGLMALVANVACMMLIYRHRLGEVHMKASWIFSKNDVIANVGVIAAGILVGITGSRYPDLAIGLAVAFVVTRGGVQILAEARAAGRARKQC